MKASTIRRAAALLLAAVLCVTFVSCYIYEEVPVEHSERPTSENRSQDASGGEESVVVSDDSREPASKKEPVSKENGNHGHGQEEIHTSTGTRPSGKVLALVENGRPKASIVVAKKAGEKALTAADDLRDYLERITGAVLPILTDDKDCSKGNYILVGPSAYTKKLNIKTPTGYPGNERVLMKRSGNYLALLGNDDGNYTGTEFAVTMFLEKLGCGWYGPQELWQVVPSLKNIYVDQMNVNHTPKFSSRINNVYSTYKPVGKRWYMGGDRLMTGHGLPALVPRSEFSRHPEWFSLINGKRTNDVDWWQYCYSNEELAQRVGEEIIRYFDANPEMISYPITQNDGWDGNWCQCSECSKYPNRSDLMVLFANRVARVVARKYPEKRLQLLSYHATLLKPSLNVRLEPNVEIMFCTEGYNITAPADTDQFRRGYDATSHNTFTESWKDNYEAYIKRTGVQHTSIWKWYCICAENGTWQNVPWVQGNVAINDQNYWKSRGAMYVFYDHGPLPGYREGSSSFALRWPLWYVAAKGSWDASLTGDDILKDACDKLYGKAGNAMFRYYRALADASCACEGYSILWVPPAVDSMYTPAQVKRIDETVKAANALRGQLTADQRKRMSVTFDYWNKTKAILS